MPLIELDDVSVRFDERIVLDGVTVTLDERRIGVIGANGSGKTTFARLLNGLTVASSGSVRVAGLDPKKDARKVRRRVGFCFTDPDAQIVMPTVAEDVAFGMRRRGVSDDEVARRTAEWLDYFGLADHRDHPAHLLSGGQKQVLALASVLVTDPDLLVLDEPTTLLDLANTRNVLRVLDDLEQQAVLVTHHLELLGGFDRVLVFDAGVLAYDGAPAEAVEYYQDLVW